MSTVEDMSMTPVGLSSRSQWFGFVTGPLIWFTHMIVFYVLSEFGCSPGADDRYFAYSAVSTAITAVTVVSIIIVAAAGIVSYRNLQRMAGVETERYLKADREYFMSWLGLWSSILFGAAIIVETSVLFFFDACTSLMGVI